MPKDKHLIKQCTTHGETNFVLEGRGYYRCMKCRQAHVSHRRRKVKLILVQESGGKCSRCGYDKCLAALAFHHLDPREKSFGISRKGVTIAISKAREEIKKCILLCSNCHAEEEWMKYSILNGD